MKNRIAVTDLTFSNHALQRMQQRGIPRCAVELSIKQGARYRAGSGAIAYHLGKKTRRGKTGSPGWGDRYHDVAAVVSPEGFVLTVMHAPRLPRHWRSKR